MLLNKHSSSFAIGTDSKSSRRFWCEEVNEDSIYSIFLQKITYSCNSNVNSSYVENDAKSAKTNGFSEGDGKRRSLGKGNKKDASDVKITRCDQSAARRVKVKDTDGQVMFFYQLISSLKLIVKAIHTSSVYVKKGRKNFKNWCLQWETRQIKTLKAATLEHIMEYVLLLTADQNEELKLVNHCGNGLLEEERNNIAHVMHVLFSTYRTYCSPYELFKILMKYVDKCCPKQFQFVLYYWITNYPEDFTIPIKEIASAKSNLALESMSLYSQKALNNINENARLVDILLSLPKIDESICRKGLSILQDLKTNKVEITPSNYLFAKGSSSCILELDAKFVAQQLTAIDLENFLSLEPYALINGSKNNEKVKNSIKNFNLLSKHVIVTILKSSSPDSVTCHWIEIASHLRKMKNFNSLKQAVIAGLTNESIYRLKNIVWSKISRNSMETFVKLSTIVDDVNNQTLLRQTQLEIEGTAKASFHEDSFGTIPYLGTFLTDLTVIDSTQPNYIQNSTNGEKKLINLEKCSKQFEIITQIQLLQKNLKAALTTFYQSQHINGLSKLPTYNCTPTIPRVARLFRNWFQDSSISAMTDNDW
ncbi:ral guanine nucleotide dissociation stimulator-like protein 1-like protein [Dinothrombium tinctorium]|uniref:Ral guanine nucleotide dissociation stimulator-like protein 1-like protein n=1 Tax=Dinothrombium tinctorium TaxID=1965070 RepID=A0A3S3P913_9ACAR|nr:ral guanine nucleotide dissociation stimulator-like protein 1-like protein [Dinothrombium tinctorium]